MKLFNLAIDRIVDFQPCPDIPFRDNPEFDDSYFDDVVGGDQASGTEQGDSAYKS